MILSLIAFLLACKSAHAFVRPMQIFSFGDSLSDTSNAHAEIPLLYAITRYPYGISYRFPDRPCERTRFSDGRLIIYYTGTMDFFRCIDQSTLQQKYPFLVGLGFGNVWSDPEHTLYWDAIHNTKVFYRAMATFALSGQSVDGPSEVVNLRRMQPAACNLDFTSSLSIPKPASCPNDQHEQTGAHPCRSHSLYKNYQC